MKVISEISAMTYSDEIYRCCDKVRKQCDLVLLCYEIFHFIVKDKSCQALTEHMF